MAAAAAAPVKQEEAFFPISELSAYNPSGWTIRARVTQKSQLRTWEKAGKAGKVFSVDLLDEHGGEIRASFFNEAVDQFSDKVQSGKCYTFSRGSCKVANRQFTQCKHRYELVFDKIATVKEVADIAQIQAYRFSVTSLKVVQSRPLPWTGDICGVITAALPSHSFTSKEGKELVKREVTIADDTAITLTVTLWGDRAKMDDKHFEGHPVVGLKGVLVKEFQGGRSGSLLAGGAMELGPKIPEAAKVQQWWQQGGSTQSLSDLSAKRDGSGGNRPAPNAKPIDVASLRRAAESATAQPELYSMVCRLAFIQTKKRDETQPLVYMACMEPKEGNGLPCNRRVDSSGFCAVCNRAGKSAPRFALRCRFSDSVDSAWITTFHEGARSLLSGITAEKAQELDKGDEALREAALRERYFSAPLQVTVRVKTQMYNNESRPDISCVDARPVSRGDHGRAMLKEIGEMIAAH